MTDKGFGWRELGRALAAVDWPRVLSNVGTFARALRGDDHEQIQRESIRARDNATRVTTSLEDLARKAAGCVAPAPCTCSICREGNKP